jgi:hypothetical protein
MVKETITIDVALLYSGNVNVTETMDRFKEALHKRACDIEDELARIAKAVDEIFDENKGQSIRLATIACIACDKMNVPVEAYTVISKRVLDYIHRRAKHNDSQFIITAGKNGGVKRRYDSVKLSNED